MLEITEKTQRLMAKLHLNNMKMNYDYSPRFKNVLAQVEVTSQINDTLFCTLRVGDMYFKLDDYSKQFVLQHELAHLYDTLYNKRNSKHDKVFKDLCGGLYGNRYIGRAKINLKQVEDKYVIYY